MFSTKTRLQRVRLQRPDFFESKSLTAVLKKFGCKENPPTTRTFFCISFAKSRTQCTSKYGSSRWVVFHYYRPQTKFAKVMLLQVSVILSTGETMRGCSCFYLFNLDLTVQGSLPFLDMFTVVQLRPHCSLCSPYCRQAGEWHAFLLFK